MTDNHEEAEKLAKLVISGNDVIAKAIRAKLVRKIEAQTKK